MTTETGIRIAYAARSRFVGTFVEVIDNRNGSYSHDGEPWLTVCEHGYICSHRTRAIAMHHRSRPDGWCERCRAIVAAFYERKG